MDKTVGRVCPICESSMKREGDLDLFICHKYPTKHRGTEEEMIVLGNKGKKIRQLITISEYSKRNKIERTKVYRLIRTGKLTLYKGLRYEPLLDPTENLKNFKRAKMPT